MSQQETVQARCQCPADDPNEACCGQCSTFERCPCYRIVFGADEVGAEWFQATGSYRREGRGTQEAFAVEFRMALEANLAVVGC